MNAKFVATVLEDLLGREEDDGRSRGQQSPSNAVHSVELQTDRCGHPTGSAVAVLSSWLLKVRAVQLKRFKLELCRAGHVHSHSVCDLHTFAWSLYAKLSIFIYASYLNEAQRTTLFTHFQGSTSFGNLKV